MADRSSAAIRIGGCLQRAALPDLVAAIAHERLSTDWDGGPFTIGDLVDGEPLYLVAHEVVGGELDHLEYFCRQHALAYARWSGGCSGSYGAERVVFAGTGAVSHFAATDDDDVMISLEDIERLGSLPAIRAHFAAANMAIPPLELIGKAGPDGGDDG